MYIYIIKCIKKKNCILIDKFFYMLNNNIINKFIIHINSIYIISISIFKINSTKIMNDLNYTFTVTKEDYSIDFYF